tara:strand:+ start:2443 stop:3444 length:1002 start_codon:yes stop_codon:yes gene_type:complete
MGIPSASLTTIAIKKESTLAGSTTDTTASLRVTAESIVPAISTISSEEIDATRNVSDLNKVSSQAEGDIEFEFSADGPVDALITSVLQTGSSGANDVDNMTDNTSYQNGTTQTSYAIEKKTTDGSTNFFQLYQGMVPASLELTGESGSFVTGTVGFVGAKVNAMSGSGTLTSTLTTSTQPFSTVDSNTNIKFNTGAASVTNAEYGELTNVVPTAFSLNFDNGLRAQTQIGTTDLAGIGAGRFTATGSLTVYANHADSQTLFNNYINTTRFGMCIQIGNSTDNYRFYLPEVIITSAQVLAGGNDEDVLMELEFQAVKTTVGSDNFTVQLVKNEA